MKLTYKLINRTPSLQFDQVKNYSMNEIPYIYGGYYIIDVEFLSGMVLHTSFLRLDNAWIPIYAFVQPPTQNINNPSNSLPPLFLMSSADVNNDTNLLEALNQLSGPIQQLIGKDGYVLNKIERGTYANGSILFVLTYSNQMITSYLIFQIIVDPVSSQILYAKYTY